MRTPSPDELEAFFAIDGWVSVRTTNHAHYEKVLPTGELLESHASFGSRPLGPRAFKLLLALQLHVSEAEFWDVLRTRHPARRPSQEPEAMPVTIPVWLAHALEAEGLSRSDIEPLAEEDARRLLDALRSRPRDA